MFWLKREYLQKVVTTAIRTISARKKTVMKTFVSGCLSQTETVGPKPDQSQTGYKPSVIRPKPGFKDVVRAPQNNRHSTNQSPPAGLTYLSA